MAGVDFDRPACHSEGVGDAGVGFQFGTQVVKAIGAKAN
jgi:hypothetical protein